MCNENDGVALYSTSHPVKRWPPLWWLRISWWWRMGCRWNPWKTWHYQVIEINPTENFYDRLKTDLSQRDRDR